MSQDSVFLMYHELECPGRALCDQAPGYTHYVVPEAVFATQLARLRDGGRRGVSVSEALAGVAAEPTTGPPVSTALAITFDDGCETDLLLAAPLLRQANFGATFFIVAGWVGRRGFLNREQLRELSDHFEIGCHGMTHAFLSDVDDAQLRVEMVESKAMLQDIIGREVAHFSCPGGRWDARVPRVAREVGYHSVSTSRPGRNGARADFFRLARMTVTRSTDESAFDRLCRGELSPGERARGAVLGAAKSLLGNGVYQRARQMALERPAKERS